MGDFTVTTTEGFYVMNCADCSVRFAVTKDFETRRRTDKKSFYCPNGHSLSWSENEADVLRRERDRLAQRIAERDDDVRREREAREAAKRSVSAIRGQMTKLKKRTANGICPCCTRSFVNLRRHIETKHPDFGTDATNVVALKAVGGSGA